MSFTPTSKGGHFFGGDLVWKKCSFATATAFSKLRCRFESPQEALLSFLFLVSLTKRTNCYSVSHNQTEFWVFVANLTAARRDCLTPKEKGVRSNHSPVAPKLLFRLNFRVLISNHKGWNHWRCCKLGGTRTCGWGRVAWVEKRCWRERRYSAGAKTRKKKSKCWRQIFSRPPPVRVRFGQNFGTRPPIPSASRTYATVP